MLLPVFPKIEVEDGSRNWIISFEKQNENVQDVIFCDGIPYLYVPIEKRKIKLMMSIWHLTVLKKTAL